MRTKHVWANVLDTIPIATAVVDVHSVPYTIIGRNPLFSEKFSGRKSGGLPERLESYFSNQDLSYVPLYNALNSKVRTEKYVVLLDYGRREKLKITISPLTESDPDETLVMLYFEEITPSQTDRTNSHFQSVIENLDGIFWMADASTLQFTYISPQLEQILGYTQQEWLADPNFWASHIYPDDREQAIEFCHIQTELGNNHTFEYRMIDSKGEIVWLKDVVSILPQPDGSRLLIGLMIDATEHKQTESLLINKRNELDQLLKLANEGLYGLDESGNCTFINDAGSEMLGVSKEELIGRPMHRFIHPPRLTGRGHQKKTCPVCNPALLKGRVEHQTMTFFRQDGTPIQVRYSSIPITENDQNKGAVVTFEDITEFLETTHRLQQATDALNRILQQSLDLICSFDKNGRFVHVNDACRKILGYEPIELIGKRYMDFLVAEDVKQTLRTGKVVMGGGSRNNFENRYVRKDGTVVPILWSARWDADEGLMYCTGKDATELHQAKAELELRERRFRQLVKGGTDIIAVLDKSGKCTYVSPTSNPLLGYSSEEFTGQNAFEHIHPDDIAEVKRVFTQLHDGEIAVLNVFRFRHKNGTWRWMETSLKDLSDDPAVNGLVANLRDVTERINALRQVEESNERYRYVLRATFDAIWDWDIANNQVHWGEGLYELFGHESRNEHNTFDFWLDNIHPDDLARVRGSLTNAMESDENWRDEYRFRRSDGSYSYVVNKSLIIRNDDGLATRMVGAIQDITIRKTEELRLKLLESVIVNMTDAVLVIRVDEGEEAEPIIVYCNKAFSEMTGYSLSEVYGKSALFFERPERDMEVIEALYEAYDEKKSFECELEYYKKDGELFWLNIVLSPIFDENGQCSHFIAIERDITERKKSDLKLKELYDELEVHAKKLSVSNHELEQFAYVASHDLQEPLRMVTGFLSLIERKYADKLDDKARQFIFYAVDGAQRMRQIILDLLEYSRVGKESDMAEDIDISLLIEDILSLHKKQLSESNAEVIYQDMPVIRSYRSPLRHVFQNLISNGLKYQVKDHRPVIQISSKPIEGGYEFCVSDNGIGIAPEYHEKIFNIFQRLHSKDEYSGSGMGLAITKKVIENLGGEIRVESTEGKGSMFIFTIYDE